MSVRLRGSRHRLVKLGAGAVAGIVLAGCALNPVTRRPQMVLTSTASEIELGQKAAEAEKALYGVVDAPEVVEYVQQLGARVAARSPRADVPYSFDLVLHMYEPNAYALPGGPIFLSRSMLVLTNSEDELVSVLGHEVGHIAARHYTSSEVRRTGAGLLTAIGSIGGAMAGGPQLAQAVGVLGQYGSAGFLAAHSREHEREADEVGQRLAAEAGWDPGATSSLMRTFGRDIERMLGHKRRASWLDTHPATPEREAGAAERARLLERAPAEPIARTRREYLERLRGLVLEQDPEQGIFLEHETRNVFHHPDFDLRIRFPDEWATFNTPNFVGAAETDGSVELRLKIAPEAETPEEAADAFLDEELEKIIPRKRRPGRVERYESYEIEFSNLNRTAIVNIIWIQTDERMYQLECLIAAPLHSSYVRDCYRTARSMRSLRPKEREGIRRIELALATARAGETLTQLGERTDNHWDEEQTAIVNAIDESAPLEEGQLLKIALAKPYVPKPKPVEPPASEESEAEEVEEPDSSD